MRVKVKLGEVITVNHRLVRERQNKHCTWKIQILPKPIKVTVVGVRVLWNGEMDIQEEGAQFIGTQAKRAVLVAPNLKSIFYVYVD
jgi:hypothetical protein